MGTARIRDRIAVLLFAHGVCVVVVLGLHHTYTSGTACHTSHLMKERPLVAQKTCGHTCIGQAVLCTYLLEVL